MEDHYEIFLQCPTASVEAIALATNGLIVDELDYDMLDVISRFESLARGSNLDYIMSSDQWLILITEVKEGHFFYMVAVAQEKLICEYHNT